MTVEIQTNYVIHTGNGVTTQFPYTFRIPEISMVTVALLDATTNNVVQVLTYGVDFNITGVSQDNYDGGDVEYPLVGDPMPSTNKLLILRTVPFTQGLDLENQGGFYPESVEYQLDKIVFQIQQLGTKVSQTMQFPLGIPPIDPQALIDAADDAQEAKTEAQAAAATAVEAAEEAAASANLNSVDSGGSAWTDGKQSYVISRAIPKFLTPEMYIGLETQIIYAPAGNPIDVSGATDFSVAFDAMRAEMLTLIEDVEWPSGFNWKRHKFGITLQPGLRYRVDSPINFTGFQTRGLLFNGNGAQIFGNMNAGPVIDLIGSAGWSIRDLSIEADNSSTHNPDIGIMFGRNVASQVCEGFSMDRVRVDGWFRKAGVYNYASELFNAQGLHVISYMQDAPAFWLDSRNTLDIAAYTAMTGTLAAVGDDASCIQHTFIGGALRNIQENQYGCLRIDSTRDADLNRVRGIKLINTYFTNNGTDTDTVRPAVGIRGPVDGFHYDGHSELSTPTDSIVNLSHLLYLDVTDAANPAVFHDYKIREFFSDAEIAVVGRSNNTANLHLIDWDIGVGYSRGAYPSGTPAKLFGSNFSTSNTWYEGKISTGDVDPTFLNVDSVLFDGIIQTEEALPNIGLSLGSRAWIQTANAGGRGYFKQASKNVSADGAITVDGYEIINLTGSVKAVSFASNTRFHRFAVVNSTSNLVVISGLAGANKLLAPGATANIVQNASSFFAEGVSAPVILDESAAKVDLTGSTSETTLKTITIPAKAMGANGSVRVTLLASANNNANTKTLRVKFGGTTFHQTNLTTQLSRQAIVIIRNRNSESSQVGNPVAFDGIGAASAVVITSAVDTTADVTLLITGQLANGADDMHLEGYTIEVCPSP